MNQHVNLIAGIYTHCDTWCERCLFTNRCHSYQIQSEAGLIGSANVRGDMVQQLTDALSLTKQYIDRLNRTHTPTGSDEAQAQRLEENALRRDEPVHHPATVLANQYLKQTGVWLQQEKDLLKQTGQQHIREVELGLRTEQEAMPMLHALKDAWEMIHWYRTLIPVKTQSVLRALTDPTDDPHLTIYYLGKAKLVLVSIDRSLLAWQTIVQCFPEKTDDLLSLLALLTRLRREMELLFPNAQAFQRPGLD